MSTGLTGLSYVVMNLIGRHGAGPHDLVQMARRGQRLYWAGAESKIYAEPKRLEKLGYLTSEKMPGKTRERTHYKLTQKALHALQEWLALPSRFPRIQSDAAIRVQASDLADDPGVVLESLDALREEIAELAAILDESERREVQFPHRQRQLRLLHSLGRRLLRAHLEWIDEVEHELGPRPAGMSSRAEGTQLARDDR
jgi:PadR family transcriptional regulator AphA